MSISDVVNVSFTAAAVQPSLPNFGLPLIAAYTTVAAFANARTQLYGGLAAMVTAGFTTTSPAYKAASAIFSQSPTVPNIKVGKRALPYTQTLVLTALTSTTGAVYSFSVGGQAVTYTVPSSSSANSVAAALTTAITALSITGLTATNPGSPSPNVQLQMTAGLLVDFQTDPVNLSFSDNTSDPGIATDLAAIDSYDPAWYGLVLDSNSKAEALAAAAWTEANGPVLFMTNNSDTAVANSGSTTDVLATLKGSSYARTVFLFSQSQLLSYSGAAWMGRMFTQTPGSSNFAYKTLAGVPADTLTEGQLQAVWGKNGSTYTLLAGVNVTQFGKTPSGSYADITWGTDALVSGIQLAIYGLFIANQKVPYTDLGMDMIRSAISGQLQLFITRGFLASTPAPVINIPAVSTQSQANVAARSVTGTTITATLAGAVNSVTITGTLNLP